ncbi:MAG: M20/M25/M40 family metallo-hydrolase [Dysosmobacter sp.]
MGAGCYAAAVALKDYLIKEKKDGTVIFFGCPAEEGAGSKQFIARAGYFDNVDFAYTWHPETVNEVGSRGSVAIMGANFTFDGIAAHAGGEPHLGRSALDAVELMNVGCNYLREHMIDAARIHYAYSDPGGTAPNVVQSHAVIKYEVRAPKVSQVQELFTRVVDVARGAALMTGTKMKYEITMAFSDYVPNRTLGAVVDQCMRELGAPEWTEPDYRLAAEFLRTYPRTTMVGIREKLGYYFEPEELDAALEKPLDRIIHPFNPKGDRLQFRLHRRGRRGLRHPHRHVPRGHRLPGQCGPLLAEHRLCLLRYRYEGHAAAGGDHDPGCHPHHGPAGGHRQGPGGTEAEKRRQLPLPPAGLRDASHRPLLSFTAFSRPCRSGMGGSVCQRTPAFKYIRPIRRLERT